MEPGKRILAKPPWMNFWKTSEGGGGGGAFSDPKNSVADFFSVILRGKNDEVSGEKKAE